MRLRQVPGAALEALRSAGEECRRRLWRRKGRTLLLCTPRCCVAAALVPRHLQSVNALAPDLYIQIQQI